jgi:hypothetical protein
MTLIFYNFENPVNYALMNHSRNANFYIKSIFLVFFLFVFSGKAYLQNCKLYQASFNGSEYVYALNSLPSISVVGAPKDTDWTRWSIVNDRSVYRLYFMPIGRSDKLYQFGFNPSTNRYEYGYESMPVIPVFGLPFNTSVSSFSILFDGETYRLYFKSKDNLSLYQCAYNENTQRYEFGFNSIAEILISNVPNDIDLQSWSMLYDGNKYRLYFASKNNRYQLFQFAYNGQTYEYGYGSMPIIDVIGMPTKNFVKKFNIIYDGEHYRYYNLEVIY